MAQRQARERERGRDGGKRKVDESAEDSYCRGLVLFFVFGLDWSKVVVIPFGGREETRVSLSCGQGSRPAIRGSCGRVCADGIWFACRDKQEMVIVM